MFYGLYSEIIMGRNLNFNTFADSDSGSSSGSDSEAGNGHLHQGRAFGTNGHRDKPMPVSGSRNVCA